MCEIYFKNKIRKVSCKKQNITLRGAKRREKQVIGIVNKVSLLGTREEVDSGRGEVKGQPGSSN